MREIAKDRAYHYLWFAFQMALKRYVNPRFLAHIPNKFVAMLITLLALILMNAMDLSHYLIVSIAESYEAMPLGVLPETGSMMKFVTDTLAAACYHALQLSGPFLVYGILANLLFAILGKLVPQVPSYFISGPFIAFGGLVLLYLACGEMVVIFGELFRSSMRQL